MGFQASQILKEVDFALESWVHRLWLSAFGWQVGFRFLGGVFQSSLSGKCHEGERM